MHSSSEGTLVNELLLTGHQMPISMKICANTPSILCAFRSNKGSNTPAPQSVLFCAQNMLVPAGCSIIQDLQKLRLSYWTSPILFSMSA